MVGAGSPEELIAACANGDREAFRLLYREFSALGYSLAMRILRDEHLAQDSLQDAFALVWSRASSFDPARATGQGWILTFVHRRAVDRVRREQAERERMRDWVSSQQVSDHDSVAEIVELRSDHRMVRDAMGTLTNLQREVIELSYYKGLTQAQIAVHLDIPLGTAKTRMRDALKRLRQELEATA